MTTVLERPAAEPGVEEPSPRHYGQRGPHRAGAPRGPGLGPPGAHRPPGRDGHGLHLGARRLGLGQLLLLGGRAGRNEELEGVLLRLVRLVELHHRRQAPRRALGDGDLGADLRSQLVEHPRAPGVGGRGRGGAALRDGAAVVPTGRRAHRRCRAGDDARGRADVPLQQSRRPLGAALRPRHLRHGACARTGEHVVAGAGGLGRRHRASSPRCSRPSSSCPPSPSCSCSPRRRRSGSGCASS